MGKTFRNDSEDFRRHRRKERREERPTKGGGRNLTHDLLELEDDEYDGEEEERRDSES